MDIELSYKAKQVMVDCISLAQRHLSAHSLSQASHSTFAAKQREKPTFN